MFKKKNCGRYRARLCALGYTQITGVYYTENYAPVINDATLRTALTISIKNTWEKWTIDVETAFLKGTLEEDIYIKLLPDYYQILPDLGRKFKDIEDDLTEDDICQLLRTIYGIVQATRCWYKKIAKTLTDNLDYERSPIDP